MPSDGDKAFAESLAHRHSAKGAPIGPHVIFCVECLGWHLAKKKPLSSATTSTRQMELPLAPSASSVSSVWLALDKETWPVSRCAFFAECYGHCTRQRHSLLSVTLYKVTKDPPFYLFLLLHLNKQYIYIYISLTWHMHHRTITCMMYHQHHISHKTTKFTSFFRKLH
jgi:hypothetical protein